MENPIAGATIPAAPSKEIGKFQSLKLFYGLFFWFAIVMAVIEIPLVFLQSSAEIRLSGSPIDFVQVALSGLISTLQTGLGLSAAVFFFMFVYRACSNLYTFGEKKLEYSPGWSIAWFFIPLFNLGVPYGVMSEITKKSTSGISDKNIQQSKPTLIWVILWWAIVLIYMVSIAVLFFYVFTVGRTGIIDFMKNIKVQISGLIVGFIHTGVTILMLRQITKLQEARAKAISPGTVAG